MKLTAKQQLFVKEYLVDLNATQAAIRAGYSKKTAHRIGAENLQKHAVSTAIEKALNKRTEKIDITAERVLQEIAKIAFANMGEFVKWANNNIELLDSEDLTDEQLACISEIVETDTKHGKQIKFKLHDKLAALHKLSQHLGLFREKGVGENDPLPAEKVVYYVNDEEYVPETPYPAYSDNNGSNGLAH